MGQLLHTILHDPIRPIIYVHPDITVKKVVELMVKYDIGALVVSDDDNLLGIVSERDIVRSLVNKGLSPDSTPVSDILCADITVLKKNDSIEKAMESMIITKRRHILIADEESLPIAIVSIGDILFNLLEDKTRAIEQLENYIHG